MLAALTIYNICFVNLPAGNIGKGFYEILSLTGTVSENGSHIHITGADSAGKTIGGHLLQGCIINTNAEVIIVESERYILQERKILIHLMLN